MIPLLWVAGLLAADPAPTIQLTPATADTGPRVVARLPPNVARALPKPAATLTLRVTPDSPAIFGETKLEQNQLTFTPRFPLTPGLTYRATLHLPGQESVTVSLTVPQPEPKPAATITHIYPTASTLPENTLRFYLCFSRPMTRGDAAKYISLLDADEQPVPAPFLHFEQELWSPDGTRFTLLFDPGRIKQELVPRQELGPPLVRGRKYTLRVDPVWPDENGQPLRAEVRKTFTAGPPDAQPVLPKQWVLIPPPARSFQPVILKLAKPHDRFLLERLLRVTDAAGKTVPGQITVGGGERIVTFAPTTAWQPGQYQLIVDTRLEDVCGNRVGEPFEVDIFREITQRIVPEFLMRPFLVK